MTDLLEQVKEALEGATPGSWREGVEGNMRVYGPDTAGQDSGLIASVFKGRTNARLIALAPAMARALIAQEERLKAADALAKKAKEAAQTFSDYAGLHWAKNTPEGKRKGDANIEKARELFAALSDYHATGGSDG